MNSSPRPPSAKSTWDSNSFPLPGSIGWPTDGVPVLQAEQELPKSGRIVAGGGNSVGGWGSATKYPAAHKTIVSAEEVKTGPPLKLASMSHSELMEFG